MNPGLQTASRTGGRAAITFTGTGHHLRPGTVITLRRKPPSRSTGIHHHHRPEHALWSWAPETATHVLRLVLAGVFNRWPTAQVIVGHGGEALPYFLWRFDSRFALNTFGIRLGKRPSAYLRENVSVTTAGLFSTPPLRCAIDELGEDRVLFSIDYPYESSKVAGEWFDAVDLPRPVLDKVAHRNAVRLLRLGNDA